MIRSFKVALNWKAYLKDPHDNISLSTTMLMHFWVVSLLLLHM